MTNSPSAEMRLQKFLAQCGQGSRRSCERLIDAGRVSVNDKIITEQGTRVNPANDEVKVDGQLIQPQNRRRMVIMFHKPAGCVTTRSDPNAATTVYDLLPDSLKQEVFPVGRLDKDTEGLLLFTNDGNLSFRLLHPAYSVDKTYEIIVKHHPEESQIKRLEPGVQLDGYFTAPAKVSSIQRRDNTTVIHLIIHEGRKRQVRRMCRSVGLRLRALKRLRVGPLELGNLPLGQWRELSPEEIRQLEADTQG
jgi:pseudouridine synthase